MAVRLPLEKIEAEKAEYIKYLLSNLHEPAIVNKFQYRSFYENDAEVLKVRIEVANKRKEQEKKLPPQPQKATLVVEKKVEHNAKPLTEKENKNDTNQYFENLLKCINDLKQKLKSSRILTPEQKSEIEKLHHEVIFHTGWNNNQLIQINKSILNLQKIADDIESAERRRPIRELIDELKTLTIENGFIQKRKSIRTKIKTDKKLLKEDVKVLLHKLNQTVPYVYEMKPPKVNVDGDRPAIVEPSKMVEELVIPWTQIAFGNNIIRITDTNGKFLLAPKVNCRKSYNQIKEYLADKLPQVLIIKNASKGWTLKEPIVFHNALLMIKQRVEEELIQEEQYKRALRSFDSMEDYLQHKKNQELVLKRLRDRRQDFLNYLIKYQIEDYKLVPAIEMISHESSDSVSQEEVFIFTIPHRSYRMVEDFVNIVYENVNEARATIVCTVERCKYTQVLQSLFNFMNDEKQKNKRSRLHQTLILNSAVRRLHVVNHTDMHTWAMGVQH